MTRNSLRALGILAASLALTVSFGSPASAVVTLTLENPGSTSFQQTLNNPCVIGDSSCNNPGGFGSTTLPGGASMYDAQSPLYTVQQIRDIVGNLFMVGVDVNTTTSPIATERLDLFELSINGVVQFSYDPASPGTPLVTQANGNGFSDELLKGFDLSSFAGGASAQFHAVVNNATDGREQFFLISNNVTQTPEPASVALLGFALLGLGAARFRRQH
jgi:hypothetical protein